ncbi:MAG: amidohydrolase family protein [Bryobacterales bacterium]
MGADHLRRPLRDGKGRSRPLTPVIRPQSASAIGPQVQETFRKAYKAGVKIAFGTDCGVSPHGTNAREFLLMNEAGMPPLETIQAATLRPAQLLGVENETGTLTAGKEADIVATPADPSQDLSTVMNVSFVMSDGVVYKRP